MRYAATVLRRTRIHHFFVTPPRFIAVAYPLIFAIYAFISIFVFLQPGFLRMRFAVLSRVYARHQAEVAEVCGVAWRVARDIFW